MTRLYRSLVTAEKAAACVLLVAVLVLILFQVVSRYVFATPFGWTLEIARFALIWLTFVGAGFVMSQRLHISMDLLVTRLGRLGSMIVDTFAHVIVVTASAAMAVFGTAFAVEHTSISAPASGWSMAVVYAAGAVGFGLIAFHGVVNAVSNFIRPALVPSGMDNIDKAAA